MQANSLQKNRPVALWLYLGIAMIIVQILLGGITRLTGSGLSITEWKPILGALPPTSEQQWLQAFEKYKQIAQYRYINNHFSLQDFKAIYFWEWLHRNWGRFMGLVFAGGFIYFLIKKRFDKSMVIPMVILFVLGAMQGAVGWLMVSSGVGTSLVYVDHIKLAVHFIAALILLVYILWFALKITVPAEKKYNNYTLKIYNLLLLVLLTVQLVYGAFMAGTHAGKAAVTWPDINGAFIPASLAKADFLQDLIAIQFVHRTLAYLLAAAVILYFFMVKKMVPKGYRLRRVSLWPLLLVIVQVALGIITVINFLKHEKLYLALAHQFTGILLLISLVATYYYTGNNNRKLNT